MQDVAPRGSVRVQVGVVQEDLEEAAVAEVVVQHIIVVVQQGQGDRILHDVETLTVRLFCGAAATRLATETHKQ